MRRVTAAITPAILRRHRLSAMRTFPLPPASASPRRTATSCPAFSGTLSHSSGRLGCNGRACHGSFQGQGGFRLSLFGYDFKADHEALLGGKEPRIDLKNPAKSLALLSRRARCPQGRQTVWTPTAGNTTCSCAGSRPGAGHQSKDADFASLHVEPREIVFDKAGSDGTAQGRRTLDRRHSRRRHATVPFRSNDESVATVGRAGVGHQRGQGRHGSRRLLRQRRRSRQVLLPVSEQFGSKFPRSADADEDRRTGRRPLRKLGIVPSDLCTRRRVPAPRQPRHDRHVAASR